MLPLGSPTAWPANSLRACALYDSKVHKHIQWSVVFRATELFHVKSSKEVLIHCWRGIGCIVMFIVAYKYNLKMPLVPNPPPPSVATQKPAGRLRVTFKNVLEFMAASL
jgi:hypothetical protein